MRRIGKASGQQNLLVVTPYFSTHGGGIESVAWQLMRHMSAASPTLAIEWMASDCDGLPQLQKGIRFLPARCWNGIEEHSGLPVPLWSIGALGRLWRAISRTDAVHLHDVAYFCSALSVLLCLLARKPYYVTQHTGFVEHPNRWIRALRDWINRVPGRFMLQRAEAVVFISDEVRRAFTPLLPRQQLRFVANGVDTNVFCDVSDAKRAQERRALCQELGFDESRPLLLFVGRFVEMKGILIALELSRRFPNCNWIFAGAGPLDPSESLGPNARVVKGRRGPTLAAVYRAADLLLLPSYSEGFPLVVQEALACGTPVLIESQIGNAAPAAREWMNFEKLERTEDDIERWNIKLGATLDEMTANQSSATELRHQRAQWAQGEWNWDQCARSYLELFEPHLKRHTK